MAVDRESVLAAGAEARDDKVRAAYAAVAVSYAEQLCDELAGCRSSRGYCAGWSSCPTARPSSRSAPARATSPRSWPKRGGRTGLDLTPQMVDEARRRYPGVNYQVGDLRRLMRPDQPRRMGAVLAWYSLIHLAASELPAAIGSLAGPCAPNGWLVLALHAGAEVRTITDWFGHEVDLDVVLHDTADVVAIVTKPACAMSSGTTPAHLARRNHPAPVRPRPQAVAPPSRTSVSLDGCVIRGG